MSNTPPSQPQSVDTNHHVPESLDLDSQPVSPTIEEEPSIPKISPSRNAVLQHGNKPDGNAPYTPAPPKSGQAGLLGVFRRLSSSSASNQAVNRLNHGLVERKTLNVDSNRERCTISELKQAKLRRVSFCVDVEIAPMPKYSDGEVQPKPIDKSQKKRLTEKGEGEALKHPKAVEEQVENEAENSTTQPPEETKHIDPIPASTDGSPDALPPSSPEINNAETANGDDKGAEKDGSKKKEKKKRSEEERKARKEKRRRLAEDSGSIPMEIHFDSSDSSLNTPESAGTPRITTIPTTNPARIYRRCCQLRETPILKKITEQLMDSANTSTGGVVNKLDLTGYWMQFADLVTLGDYLAVVPVREVLLENIGLTDEGLRVILAGLLAAKKPDPRRRKPKHELQPQGGIVERLVLKNNKLGPDGWKHLSLFLYMCRSLKSLDVSHIVFPRQAPTQTKTATNNVHVPRSIADIFAAALTDRLGGSMLEIINLGETEPSMDQLGVIMDGIIKCKVPRLGLAHNNLDEKGVAHVSRYLAAGFCEGLDLGGNDLKEHMDKIASALPDSEPLWAVSLAGCNLNPSALSKIMPVLTKMQTLRFIDLSHNHDLFQSKPSAVGLLRR